MVRLVTCVCAMVSFAAVQAADVPAGYRAYQVRVGDSLYEIAERELGSGERWREIRKADGFVTADDAPRLQVGMTLFLPSGGSVKPQPAGKTSTGLCEIFSREAFDRAFPVPPRHEIYTYEAFVRAAATFPKFCGEGTVEQRKRELASFLANVAHETTSLKYAEEIKKGDPYREAHAQWPPRPGKKYFGRGPLQLSWNYNYGMAGDALGLDLLGDPDLVARDGEVAFKTALWFWMTPQSPKPSCHDAMTGHWKPNAIDVRDGRKPGFGMTIVVINGGLEAGKPNDERVKSRIQNFEKFARELGVTVGENVSCESMKPYPG